ncbi:hypothetical protein IT084_14735 [Desulfallas sp. Bu1-1]|uniref:hypothetical protein n=1 Tax=Desulfallas sp. Bu1-1 TaxID=2787620 RepID=UPI0018A0662E|nr:hypothetical protein [Desulfallas sp. Bu1-1]MBF7084210.1 hypothetical protein [Desulfallas sp. Bu1-1]
MKKVLPLILIVLSITIFGCNAQRKPVPRDQPEKVIPQESTIGFREVDLEQVPTPVRNIVTAMSDRQMITWTSAGNNNYIILNSGPDDENIKVDKVVQRVPRQDFLWLDVTLTEVEKKGDTRSEPVIIKLDRTDKAVNGVGFESRDADEVEEEKTPAKAPEAAPGPAAKAPVSQVKPAPGGEQPEPAAPTREITPEKAQQQQQQQNQLQQETEKEKQDQKQ